MSPCAPFGDTASGPEARLDRHHGQHELRVEAVAARGRRGERRAGRPRRAPPPRRGPRRARSRARPRRAPPISPPPLRAITHESVLDPVAVELQGEPAREERDLRPRARRRARRAASASRIARRTAPQSTKTVTVPSMPLAVVAVTVTVFCDDRRPAPSSRSVSNAWPFESVKRGAPPLSSVSSTRLPLHREDDRHVLHGVAELVEDGRA